MHYTCLDPEVMDIARMRNPTTVDQKRLGEMDFSFGSNAAFADAVRENKDWMLVSVLYAPRLWELLYQSDKEKFLEEYAKESDGKPGKIEVKEVSGEFALKYDPDYEGEKGDTKFDNYCFYIAKIGTKSFLLYKETYKGDKYKYLPWEAIGEGLGRYLYL